MSKLSMNPQADSGSPAPIQGQPQTSENVNPSQPQAETSPVAPEIKPDVKNDTSSAGKSQDPVDVKADTKSGGETRDSVDVEADTSSGGKSQDPVDVKTDTSTTGENRDHVVENPAQPTIPPLDQQTAAAALPAPKLAANILEVVNLCVTVRPQFKMPDGTEVGKRLVFENVCMRIPRGKFVALVGESGSGKSLFARAVLGLLSPARWQVSGNVIINGRETLSSEGNYEETALLEARQKNIAMIFQEPSGYFNPVMQMGQQITERFPMAKSSQEETHAFLKEQMRRVGLIPPQISEDAHVHDYSQRYAHQFSQGQQQRFMWTMALGDFELIIADEPTASLDTRVQKEIVEIIGKLRSEGSITSLMLLTHDLRLVNALLTKPDDHVYFLKQPEENRPYTTMFEYPVSRLFSKNADIADPIKTDIATACSCGVLQTNTPAEVAARKNPTIEIEELVQSYRHGLFGKLKPIISIDRLTIYKGEIFGIVGESGCGKSTLARSIARLLNDTDRESQIRYYPETGQPVNLVQAQKQGMGHDTAAMHDLRKEIQIIFQDAATSFDPQMSIGEMLQETVALIAKNSGRDLAKIHNDLTILCSDLRLIGSQSGMAGFMEHYPDELSAGQKQRLSLARALLTSPRLLIADEPFTNVDRTTVSDMVRVLHRRRDINQATCIVISHDLSLVLEICDRIAVMQADPVTGIGSIKEIGDPKTIAKSSEPYIQKLLSSILPICQQ